MENREQGGIIIREMAEAALRELEFYRELRKRRTALSIWKPKAELNAQQELALQNSICDHLLKQVAKNVLEEVQYNKNGRKAGLRFLYWFFGIMFIALVIVIGLIIWWEHNKPPKKNYLKYGKH